MSEDEVSILGGGGKVDQESLFRLYQQQEADDDAPISVRFVLARDLNKRLDKYLVDRVPFLSRTSLQRLVHEEAVTVNGRVPKPSTKLRKGDTVVVVLPPPPSTEIPAEDIPIDVLYEDDNILVLNKRDDIIVHPARGNLSGTMINAVAWHLRHRSSGSLSTVGEEFARPGVVHRLDRHTTGVMVMAKTDTAHWRLGKQFEGRTTEKRYLAVVHGRMEPHADVIDLPLGKHMTIREKYAVRWDETGKPSTTIYRVREVYGDYSLVELELKTGRTHQIRVHLSHIGFPIAGDDMYGGRHVTWDEIQRGRPSVPPLPPGEGPGVRVPPSEPGTRNSERLRPQPSVLSPQSSVLLSRQALHAALLAFRHPITFERVEFQAPLHADMRDLVLALRANRTVQVPKVAGATIDLDRIVGGQ